MKRSIEIVTVHYNTPDLLWRLYNSIRDKLGYDILFRVIDGSETDFLDFINLEKSDKNFKFIRLGYNIHHGKGMDYAIRTSIKDYILIFDSDCKVLRSDVITEMFKFVDDETYAVGKIYKVLSNGHHTDNEEGFVLYLHPKTMLINRSMYFKFQTFKTHGAPCIYAMVDIDNNHQFHLLKNFDNIQEYVYEEGRGTVKRFGYGFRRSLRNRKMINNKRVVFNILIRTSRRPNYFKRCLDSVLLQTYSNYKIIVSYDDGETLQYLKGINGINLVKNTFEQIPNPRPIKIDELIGRKRCYAPYNLYFNTMKSFCDPNGFVIFLDDDNMFSNENSLYDLYLNISSINDMLFWRVEFPDRTIPSDRNFGKRPICGDIDSAGFSFHMKYWTDWDNWTMGDYRVSFLTYNKVPNKVYINKKLTRLQRQNSGGGGRRDDLCIS